MVYYASITLMYEWQYIKRLNLFYMNKALVLCMALLMSFQLVAQRHGISGTVSDGSDGSTMIGVNIVEKGTSNGTITDVDGDFEMTVKFP